MDKVCLVTSGSYSDYRICAVFSKEEYAQEYADFLSGANTYDGARVEVWALDEPREELRGAWEVRIGPGGEIRDSGKNDHPQPSKEADRISKRSVSTFYRRRTGEVGEDEPYMQTFNVDEYRGFGLTKEEARRSAEELRRQTIATEGRSEDEYDAYCAAEVAERDAKSSR